MSRPLAIALLCLASGLAGYGLAQLAQSPAVPLSPVAEGEPVPGERWLELAEVRRVTLRLSATTEVQPQLAEAETVLRNRLVLAGILVVPAGQPADAEIIAHLDSHHFRAFDAHGVAAELHLAGRHTVRVGGELRLIPHDIWQADTTRLVQPDAIPREVVQSLDELVQQLVGAHARARAAKR